MDLERVRLHCESLIERQQGKIKFWTSDQMLDVVTDLQRLIENQQVDHRLAEQLARMTEENRALLEENIRLNSGPLWTTFKHEDGRLAMDEYAWMTEIDAFEEEALDSGEQVRVLSETWRLVSKLVIVVGPEPEPDEDDEP